MIIFIKLALRNLFRNKKRTIISAIAIGFGLASIILSDAVTNGMLENMIKSATQVYTGEGEIVKKNYNNLPKIEDTIIDSKNILESLKNESKIKFITQRVESMGMIKSSRDFSTLGVVGIDLENEKNISNLSKVIKEGEYLEEKDLNSVMISQKIAKKLGVLLGDKVVVTTSAANSKDLSEERFRVGAIFSFGRRDIDNNLIFINIKKAKKMMNINSPHRIVFRFKKIEDSTNKKLKIWTKYNKNGNSILSWGEMIPELKSMVDMSAFSLWIMAMILFIIVSSGILNTLFMSIYERMFEFGVLKAIGTKKIQLGFLIIFEAFWLGIFSIFIGIIFSVILIYFINESGGVTAYSGIEYAGTVIDNAIYMNIEISQIFIYSFMLLFFILLISIYPAIYAARITPSKAMRERKI